MQSVANEENLQKCQMQFSGKIRMSWAEKLPSVLSINPSPAEPGYVLPLQIV